MLYIYNWEVACDDAELLTSNATVIVAAFAKTMMMIMMMLPQLLLLPCSFSPSNRVLRFGQPPRKTTKITKNRLRIIRGRDTGTHVAWRLQQTRDMHCRLPDSGQDAPHGNTGLLLIVPLQHIVSFTAFGFVSCQLRRIRNYRWRRIGWHSNNSSCVPGTFYTPHSKGFICLCPNLGAGPNNGTRGTCLKCDDGVMAADPCCTRKSPRGNAAAWITTSGFNYTYIHNIYVQQGSSA